MIEVWILTVFLANGGFVMTPTTSLEQCQATAALHTLAVHTDCYPIEMFAPGSIYAPELSPMPVPRGLTPTN